MEWNKSNKELEMTYMKYISLSVVFSRRTNKKERRMIGFEINDNQDITRNTTTRNKKYRVLQKGRRIILISTFIFPVSVLAS